MKKTLMEKGVPLKIIQKEDKYVVVLNFNKPVGKKLVKLLVELIDLIEGDVSED